MENIRAAEMWDYISKSYDFTKKEVVDFGCGYGDSCLLAMINGASYVVGIDSNPEMIEICKNKFSKVNKTSGSRVVFECIDIDNIIDDYDGDFMPVVMDVALCFSVLPYLILPSSLLTIMAKYFRVSFVECQYHGDGPGLVGIKNDDDMRAWLLECGFRECVPIGFTNVAGRDTNRTIWKCMGYEDGRE